MENVIYGTIVILNGKENTPSDIVNIFIPSRNMVTVEQMVSGNGEILAHFFYAVNKNNVTENDWSNYIDRLFEVNRIENAKKGGE